MAIIVDSGPLLAALDRDEDDHRACLDLLSTAKEPLVVPASVIVEVDHFVRRRLDPDVHLSFLRDVAQGAICVEPLTMEDYRRIVELCAKYADQDIGLVDASVVAIAERLNEPKIATLDRRHFSIIRPRHVDAFQLLPE